MRQITHRDVGRVSAGVVVGLLIVAIIVLILAVALYTLTSGYIGAGAAAPWTLSFASTGFFRNANVTDINFTVIATTGLTAGQVGFKIIPAGASNPIPVGIASSNTKAGCTEGNPFGGCGAGNGTPGSWYLVITDSSANVRAVFDRFGWIAGDNLQLSASYTLTVVSATSYIGSGDVLQAYGLAGNVGSGSVSL
jgi:hypothetical protein